MIRFPTMALACLASGCMFTLVGCGRQEAPKTATPQEVALVPDGTQLYSPDSGKPIQKNSSTPALVYDGRLYFFCCPTSMQQCQANPSLLRNARPPNGYDLRKLAGSGS
jgi:YHS domain-containing protein